MAVFTDPLLVMTECVTSLTVVFSFFLSFFFFNYVYPLMNRTSKNFVPFRNHSLLTGFFLSILEKMFKTDCSFQ